MYEFKPLNSLASVVNQPGEVSEEITWRFFPPEIIFPKSENSWYEPMDQRDSDPLVVSIRLLPRRGMVTPVRLAVWSVSLLLMLATGWLLWHSEPPVDTPSALGVPGTFDTRAEDNFDVFCEDTGLELGAILPSEEVWIDEKPSSKNPPKRKSKVKAEEIQGQPETAVEIPPSVVTSPMVEDNPY